MFDLIGLTANFIASGNGLATNKYIETIIDNVAENLVVKGYSGRTRWIRTTNLIGSARRGCMV
jgi:hypothetical protein